MSNLDLYIYLVQYIKNGTCMIILFIMLHSLEVVNIVFPVH